MSEAAEGKSGSMVKVSVEDVLGVGRASKNVLDALGVGLGHLLDPWLQSRRTAGEQQRAKSWLEVTKESGLQLQDFELQTIAERTEYRIRAENLRQQANREAIALHAVNELPALVQRQLVKRSATDRTRVAEPVLAAGAGCN